jgi:hypothetical protein
MPSSTSVAEIRDHTTPQPPAGSAHPRMSDITACERKVTKTMGFITQGPMSEVNAHLHDSASQYSRKMRSITSVILARSASDSSITRSRHRRST